MGGGLGVRQEAGRQGGRVCGAFRLGNRRMHQQSNSRNGYRGGEGMDVKIENYIGGKEGLRVTSRLSPGIL